MKNDPTWLIPAMGITLAIVLASGVRSGKIPTPTETKGLPKDWRGPWL